MPLIQDATLDNLIKFRKEEGEAFLVYRDALRQALWEASSSSYDDLRMVFNDIVQPQINVIDNTVIKKRQLLWNSLFSNLILSSGFISVGIFSGLLPPNIGELMAALGGFKFVSGLKDQIMGLTQDPEDATSNKFYFLWKAQKKFS